MTSGAAWAMLSRAMLYAKRWDAARTAAEEVFKLDYELMPGQTAADYAKAFTSAREGNTESILEYNYLASGPNHGWDQLFMPGGDNVTMGGRATPTQEMVESYELATTGGHPDWTPWHTAEGTTQTPPWADLEPRFHASVLYNGAAWKNRTVEPYVKGKDGWAEYGDGTPLAGRTTTGYYLRKMLNENYTDYSRKCTQPWIAIRLAEVYLNHAEACHMLGETKAANDDVRAIRARVGLPYTDKAGDELMAAIRRAQDRALLRGAPLLGHAPLETGPHRLHRHARARPRRSLSTRRRAPSPMPTWSATRRTVCSRRNSTAFRCPRPS